MKSLRSEIIKYSKMLNSKKLSALRSGNISARFNDGFLITPSGKKYSSLKNRDIIFVSLDGKFDKKKGIPSSEWKFHQDIYLNKKIAKSTVLQNVPIPSNESIMLGQDYHNPNAYIGKLEYSSTIITSLDLKSLYFKNMSKLNITRKARRQVELDVTKLLYPTDKKLVYSGLTVLKSLLSTDSSTDSTPANTIQAKEKVSTKLKVGDTITFEIEKDKYSRNYTVKSLEDRTITVKEAEIKKDEEIDPNLKNIKIYKYIVSETE